MDSTSIITQVSRDDEPLNIGPASEKGQLNLTGNRRNHRAFSIGTAMQISMPCNANDNVAMNGAWPWAEWQFKNRNMLN